jgi:hypothetical protein
VSLFPARSLRVLLFTALGLSQMPVLAHATVIDFEDLTGPPLFAGVSPFVPQQLSYPNAGGSGVDVFVDGGVILDETFNLPANQTSVYGTACFGGCSSPELSNPLSLSFSEPISNFFLDVYNGWTAPVTYRVADNAGHFADFTLPASLDGGHQLIGFAATGSLVTIQALTLGSAGEFDFFVDNIHFDEPLPPELVPEPGSMLLLGTGLAAAVAARRRRRRIVE